MLVLAPFGVFESWWGPFLASASQLLVGMAFAGLVYGYSTRIKNEAAFGVLFRLGVLPLTLFSGAFFPISNLGPVLEWVARLTPLWHGVNLSRMFCLDTVDWALAALNVGVLVGGHRRSAGSGRCRGSSRGWSTDGAPPRPPRAPAARRPARAAWLLVTRNYIVYRQAWKLFLTGFLEPVFFLFSIGIGVGQLITGFEVNGETIPYAEFVAPGMLARRAFNGALMDSTYNVFFKLKYEKLYDQMLATPLTTADIARGEIIWGQLRGASYSVAFLVLMWALGMLHSWWAILALPAALLIGFAFSRRLHGADDVDDLAGRTSTRSPCSSCRCSSSPPPSSRSRRTTACCGGSSRPRRSTAGSCCAVSSPWARSAGRAPSRWSTSW